MYTISWIFESLRIYAFEGGYMVDFFIQILTFVNFAIFTLILFPVVLISILKYLLKFGLPQLWLLIEIIVRMVLSLAETDRDVLIIDFILQYDPTIMI